MSHYNEPNPTEKDGEWRSKMQQLSLHIQQHLPPPSIVGTKGAASYPPQHAYQLSVSSGYSSGSGNGRSEPKEGEASPEKKRGNFYALGQSSQQRSRFLPIESIVSEDVDCPGGDWISAVTEINIRDFPQEGTEHLDKLRELFADNKKVWEKVMDEEWGEMKEVMGLGKHPDKTFLRVLSVIVSIKELRKRLKLAPRWAYYIHCSCWREIVSGYEYKGGVDDLIQFWDHHNPNFDPYKSED